MSRWAVGFGTLLWLVLPQQCCGQETAESWSGFFTKDFYHQAILPLMLATGVLAYLARPSTTDEFPAGFRKFQVSYLSVWALCVAADWLQGPYVYALYAAYGFSGTEIAQLFVAGFGASFVFGSFVGTFADKCGRKACCIAYCVLYIASCMTKHFKIYWVLMLGRITGGIATSMLFSCFECWMVSEHTQRHKFTPGLLGYMFGLMFTVMYLVAIASGLAGQQAADSFTFQPISEGSTFYTGGYLCPFDLAIALLLVAVVPIAYMWEENYGNQGAVDDDQTSALVDNIRKGGKLVLSDRRALFLGIAVSSFEGSMFAFVFNWTPALESKVVQPPHGVIFALFMMACMCGASAATLLGNAIKPANRLIVTFAVGCASFVVAGIAAANRSLAGPGIAYDEGLGLSLMAFLVFEFCVGLYFPSVGVLKSEIVPEALRGTVYNLYRMPLNAIVVLLLLSNISMTTCFKINAALLLFAMASVMGIQSAPAPDAESDGVANESPSTEMVKVQYDAVPVEDSALAKDDATVIGRRRVGGGQPTPEPV